MIRRAAALLLCGIATIVGCAAEDESNRPIQSTLIENALVVDGTGQPGRSVDVRIVGELIDAIGDLEVRDGESVIDGSGLTLTPGFIDTHTHHIDSVRAEGFKYLMDLPDATAAVSQGVTTSIVGVDGRSFESIGDGFAKLEEIGVAINVASFVGHGTIRLAVMGQDYRRAATEDELVEMQGLIGVAMAQGALGLSTGLEYTPGIFSTRDEVLALAETAASYGGRYISHLRSEDRYLWEALDEIIEIGRRTGMPVQVSHMKLGMKDLWGQAGAYLAKLEDARAEGIDITGDVYPYNFWQTTLSVLLPDRDYTDIDAAEWALKHVVPASGIRFVYYRNDPSLVGRYLSEIAADRGLSEAETMLDLIVDVPTPEDYELTTMAGMSQADVDRLLTWPHANVCSDGHLQDGHPRGAGSFTKILRYYVREKQLLTLEEAVHKMTGLAASHMGLSRRGTIAPGNYADLVLFDADNVADRATQLDSRAQSVGIAGVWVNGMRIFADGESTGNRPGRVLRHTGSRPKVAGRFSN